MQETSEKSIGGAFALSGDEASTRPEFLEKTRALRRHRNGDRRARPRFDVVGNLAGTVETWQRYEVRNISPGGALIETTRLFSPGSRLRGRLSARGRRVQVWMQVRRAVATPVEEDAPTAGRYLIGLEWFRSSPSIGQLIAALDAPGGAGAAPGGVERRAAVRTQSAGEAEIDVVLSTTIRVCDISAAGVLISSPVPLAIGDRAQLRMRPGTDHFAGEIEVRRLAHDDEAVEWLIGAAFIGLDERNRHSLDSLLVVKH